MALTDKRKRFADEFLIDMNATAAYRRAGYTAEGNAAEAAASRLLRNVKVQEYIESKQKKLETKTEMNQEWVLKKYKTIIENCITTDPNVAKSALDSVGKHLGMFTDKVKIEGSLTVEKVLEQI